MQSTLNPAQLTQALRRTPIATKPLTARTVAPFSYDANLLDEPLEQMFGRVWDDLDSWPPKATAIWTALFRPTIGGTFSLEEVAMLLAVAANTRSESLRYRALGGLKDYLGDCSGTNPALKPAAQKLLDSFTPTAPATPKETDVRP